MRSGRGTTLFLRKSQRGFTLLAVLAAMFLLALSTHYVMVTVSQQSLRERELELIRIGKETVRAIGLYYEQSPGAVKEWPPSLEALTDDRRFVTLRRHLRRVYSDPMTRSDDWGYVTAPGGGIAGIFSKSKMQPVSTEHSELVELGLGGARHYSDWRFVYRPVNGATQQRPRQ
jgi:type II secretory pathway pseudopilin PulG